MSGEINYMYPQPKPVLVIGATCVDVVIHVDQLPSKGGHCKVLSQLISLGGCAYNVANILRQTTASYTFITPVGTGLYGDFVRKGMQERGFEAGITVSEENGCCYCLVEPDGERSFVPFHGGEYAFKKEWMKDIRPSDYGYVYAGGIEINEPTGEDIVSWLEENRGPEVFFAPSPHISEIKPELVERILALHPILHLNEEESLMMSGAGNIFEAASLLYDKTKNAVIITMGEKGALCLEEQGEPYIVTTRPREAVDTTGAGDAHAGAVLSALGKGYSLHKAVIYANEVASLAVTVNGASLPEGFMTPEEFFA